MSQKARKNGKIVRTVSQTELARIVGYSTRQVQRFVEQGLPRDGEGRGARYPLAECVQWILQHVQAQADASSESLAVKRERAELLKVQRAIAEIELHERQGSVVAIEDAVRLSVEFAERFMTIVKNLPARAPSFTGLSTAEARRRLRDLAELMLSECRRHAAEVEQAVDREEVA